MSEVGHGSRRFTCRDEKIEQRVFGLWDGTGWDGIKLGSRTPFVYCRSGGDPRCQLRIAFMGQDIYHGMRNPLDLAWYSKGRRDIYPYECIETKLIN